jgi:uncharacterized protein (DUF302 family)
MRLRTPYALKLQVEMPHAQAVEAVKSAFKKEGFGVLTEIDVSATMKAKLGIDTPPYVILGMCNPSLAHEALEADPDIGVMLPCNVSVYETDGRTNILAQDPQAIVEMSGNGELARMADEAQARIERALQELE